MHDLFLAVLGWPRGLNKLKTESDHLYRQNFVQMRRGRITADAPRAGRMHPLQAHLGRQLTQALHELQRLGARAGGRGRPLAVVDVPSGRQERA